MFALLCRLRGHRWEGIPQVGRDGRTERWCKYHGWIVTFPGWEVIHRRML